MRERVVEKRLRDGVIALGGEIRKCVFPGHRGAPDRLVLFPFLPPHMVETKAPGKDAEEHQAREHARLAACGMNVLVLDTPELVDTYLAHMALYRDST
jgi:hypothetical protein